MRNIPHIVHRFKGGYKMKKSKLERYDLNKVYFMNEYNKTISYGNANVNINGVKEQLQHLESEKKRYFENVARIVNPEKENEEIKYHQYEKWAKVEKIYRNAEIILIAICIVGMFTFKHFPIWFRTSLFFGLFEILLVLLTVIIGPLLFIITKIIKYIYGLRYQHYIESISDMLNTLGNNFAKISINYYEKIDNLYLCSLDPAQRELLLLHRQQEKHNQDMLRLEKERQKAEKEHFEEQRRTRAATEELLAIEREREDRRRRMRW